MTDSQLPVAVIGAGPVGLAAAAHLAARRIEPVVFEAGDSVGAGGVPARGERENADRIAYGIPDVLGGARERYAGRRVLVVGSGHSAFNAILDLVALRDSEPATEIVWAIRGDAPDRSYGGGDDDRLPARGALGAMVRGLVADGSVEVIAGFHTRAIAAEDGRLVVDDGERRLLGDEIIAATGFRPDLDLLR